MKVNITSKVLMREMTPAVSYLKESVMQSCEMKERTPKAIANPPSHQFIGGENVQINADRKSVSKLPQIPKNKFSRA